ncbi:MAG TPA: Uma2 family endonuclease [Polyangiaceae bacterium]|nr:Uma2 family endonuclease [Polyangiaceae bacterium]
MLAQRYAEHDDTPVDDRIVVLRDASWVDYQRILAMRGDAAAPRVAYLEGALEITNPSKDHESIKSRLGCLVDVWCEERGVDFEKIGSWTLEREEKLGAVEPDESYIFGPAGEALRPDLAIEVVWTTGGVSKLEIYRRLGVREVWFWRRGRLTVHALKGEAYAEVSASEVLPGIDLAELVQFLNRPTTGQAVREYRAVLKPKA